MGVATNSTYTTVVHTFIVHVGVATNSTHTTVVHTNGTRGSGHKQYTSTRTKVVTNSTREF